jgi:hypothetical protein
VRIDTESKPSTTFPTLSLEAVLPLLGADPPSLAVVVIPYALAFVEEAAVLVVGVLAPHVIGIVVIKKLT